MKTRRTADEVARLLREIDRDLAKGLTISDVCRKINIDTTRPHSSLGYATPKEFSAAKRGAAQ